VSGFSSDWLDLRKPFDAAARDRALEERLADWARERGTLRVVDLGSGTGSNLRHLGPRLPVPQHWRLVERDTALIRAGIARLAAVAEEWRYVEADLSVDLEAVLASPVDLVTASALIDLVARDWLDRLVRLVGERRCALLVVLTYDGRTELLPAHPLDQRVKEFVNRHQRTDKGFGPALGPDAVPALAERVAALPGLVMDARSDWIIGEGAVAVQELLVNGWAEAAVEMAPELREAIVAWRSARLELARTGRSSIRVGHRDLLYLPP
jgi:hypothetical protein